MYKHLHIRDNQRKIEHPQHDNTFLSKFRSTVVKYRYYHQVQAFALGNQRKAKRCGSFLAVRSFHVFNKCVQVEEDSANDVYHCSLFVFI